MLHQLSNPITSEEKFWHWFSKYQFKLYHCTENCSELLEALTEQLAAVNEHLSFELSPLNPDDVRELIISADGVKSAFPSVLRLTETAPQLPNWRVKAFRQPRAGFTWLKYGSVRLDMNDVYFRYAKDQGKIALEMHVRNYKHCDDWQTTLFVLLDTMLGEYDTEMVLSSIEHKRLQETDIEKLFPITRLPQIVKHHKLELSN